MKQAIKTIICIDTCVINNGTMYINRHQIELLSYKLCHFTVAVTIDMYIMA